MQYLVFVLNYKILQILLTTNFKYDPTKTSKSKSALETLVRAAIIAYDDNRRTSHVFPALSVNPVDVAGAGDSLLAVMSIALASNQSLVCSSAIACCTASIAVETMGNLPISKEKLISKILNVFNN